MSQFEFAVPCQRYFRGRRQVCHRSRYLRLLRLLRRRLPCWRHRGRLIFPNELESSEKSPGFSDFSILSGALDDFFPVYRPDSADG